MRRPAVETAAFGCETAGGGWSQPPQGALQTKPATFSCRANSRISQPRVAGAAKGQCGSGRPAVENCGLRGAKPPGRFGAAPGRGLCKRSPQRLVAGRFVRFPPTGGGRGQGALGSGRPAVENCGLHLRNRQGGWGPHPTPLALSPLPTLGEGRGGNTPPLIRAPVPRGEG